MKANHINLKTLGSYAVSILVFLAVAGIILAGVLNFSNQADQEGVQTLKNGIRRASVQCYAIEGRYPPSVEYLEENYGIRIDDKRYHVFYSGFASNIMPEITVVPANQEE